MTDFDKLSDAQINVFEQIAIGNDAGHNQRTLDSLLKRGLIETYREPFIDYIGQTYITRYRVTTSAHIDWCAWCETTAV